jgi:antitoxin HicB
MEEQNKDLSYYLSLPYTIEIIRDNDEENPGWVARVVELPGCITQSDLFEELGEMIQDATRGWIEAGLETGIPIPEPNAREDYSGKFVVRVPKYLHRELVKTAARENVSLNTFISTTLGKAVGQSTADTKANP